MYKENLLVYIPKKKIRKGRKEEEEEIRSFYLTLAGELKALCSMYWNCVGLVWFDLTCKNCFQGKSDYVWKATPQGPNTMSPWQSFISTLQAPSACSCKTHSQDNNSSLLLMPHLSFLLFVLYSNLLATFPNPICCIINCRYIYINKEAICTFHS